MFWQIGPAPQPAPVVTTNVNLIAPPPDPEVIAETAVTSSQAMIMSVIAPPPIEWANDMLTLPDFWRTTPPDLTYNHPAITNATQIMRDNAWLMIGLALLATSIAISIGKHSGYGGRIAFAVIAAMGTLVWWQLGVDLNNILCQAIGAPGLPEIIRPRLTQSFNPGDHISTVILTVVYAIVSLMLMFSLVIRIVFLDVLIATGPLWLMCYATPFTEHIATKYVGLSVGLLFSQILIVVGLHLVAAFGSVGTGVGSTLLAIAVLLSLRKMPGLLSSLSTDPGGSRTVRTVTRQISRRIRR